MAAFIKVDEKAALAIVAAAGLVLWAMLDPASFQNTLDTIVGAVQGAIDGAMAGAS